MNAVTHVLACSLLLTTTACFDPIVGTDCTHAGLADCDGYCVPVAEATGECTLPDCDGDNCAPACEGDDCSPVPTPFGHVVLIGEDFAADRANPVAARILGNAVFMARDQTVRVAEFRGEATDRAVNNAYAAIDAAAADFGRSWLVVGDAGDDVALVLAKANVLLIHSQPAFYRGDQGLLGLGRSWRSGLTDFLARGGIIVLLDGPSSHSGTVQILAAAGVVAQDSCRPAISTELSLIDPTDAISVGVPARYHSSSARRFVGASDGGVVSDGVGAVVVHVVY